MLCFVTEMLSRATTNQMENWTNLSTTFTTSSTPCLTEPAPCHMPRPTIPSLWSEPDFIVISETLRLWNCCHRNHHGVSCWFCRRCSTLSRMPFSMSGWEGLFRPTPPSQMRWPPSVTTGTTTWFLSSLRSPTRRYTLPLSSWGTPMLSTWKVSV